MVKIKQLTFSNRDGTLDRFEALGNGGLFVMARASKDSRNFNLFWSKHVLLAHAASGTFREMIDKANELYREDIGHLLSEVFEGDVRDLLDDVGIGALA
jgi:hypothetical protein